MWPPWAVGWLCCEIGEWDFTFNVLSLWKGGRLRDESHLQRQVELPAADLSRCALSLRAEREERGREGLEHLRRKRPSERGKRGVCSQADFVGERFLPRFLTQGRRWLAAGLRHRPSVQRLLCMPVRDPLPQISARSQMRDRCSRQPVDTEQRGVGLLITATWVMELLFLCSDD